MSFSVNILFPKILKLLFLPFSDKFSNLFDSQKTLRKYYVHHLKI